MINIISQNEKESILLGSSLSKKCKGGEIFALCGNLGAGKTTLSKGIAKGLGIKKTVTSPTFIISNIYNIKKGAAKKLIHIDAYRLKNKSELEAIGFFELIKDNENIIIIEWANKIKRYLPKNTIFIKISPLKSDSDKRKINISSN